ncbi:Ferrous iron transport protein B [Fragilaria crotonensis]|nr:Ferrous iron transport protein B [Fragilaria crotonensis]
MTSLMLPRWWCFFTIVLLLLNDSHAFLHLPVSVGRLSYGVPLRQARPLSAAAAEGGKKTKKKTGPTFGGKIKKTKRDDDKRLRTGHEQQLTKASQRANVVLPSHKSNAPPWQVLSSKEAKKNVEVESRRRELAKQGVVMEQDEEAEGATKMLSKTLLSDADRQLVNWKRFNPSNVPTGLTFIGAYLERRLPPRIGVPEIAFLGRSNVGKSSLLNRLASSALGGSDGARVGKHPVQLHPSTFMP